MFEWHHKILNNELLLFVTERRLIMSVTKIGKEKFKIVVRLQDKKKQITISGSKFDAQLKELELRRELQQELKLRDNKCSLKSPDKFIYFSECMAVYKERGQWKPTVYNRLTKRMGKVELTNIWDELEAFVNYLKGAKTRKGKPFSSAYINRHIAQAKAAVKLAYRPLRKIDINYLEGFPLEKENNIKYRILSNDERIRLFNALPEFLRPLFYFACRVPCRISEMVNLKKENIDSARGVLVLEDGTTKNGNGRWLPIFKEFEDYINSLPDECDYIFHRFHRGRYWPLGYIDSKTGLVVPDISKYWNEACVDAKIDGFNFHKTRQQAAMQLLYDGWNTIEVMMVGGWLTHIAFKRYVHADQMMLLKRLGKWENDTSWYEELSPKST